MMPASWLIERLTIEEAEAAHPGVADERAQADPRIARPFGFLNQDWERLKAAMQPGDEIWRFSSAEDSWRHLAGRAGIALVRRGQVVETLVTRMN